MRNKYLVMLLLLLTLPVLAYGEEPAAQEGMTAEEFLASLDFKQGEITLPGKIATLKMPETFRYLSPEDTQKVLVDAWGNPPGGETLGMLVQADVGLLDDTGWAVIINYEEEGHVSDEDADSIDYDKLLKDMQENTRAHNKTREEAGYEPIELVGWATTPRYDKQTHKLYWAKELKFGNSEISSLNYNVRILGRKGVLILNLVASMPQLQDVEAAIPSILSMTDFNTGSRYADFDPSIDKIAAYGIGALVAGKVAAKVGLFAKLGGVLLALKKLWIIIFIAIGAFVKRLFGGNKQEETPTESR